MAYLLCSHRIFESPHGKQDNAANLSFRFLIFIILIVLILGLIEEFYLEYKLNGSELSSQLIPIPSIETHKDMYTCIIYIYIYINMNMLHSLHHVSIFFIFFSPNEKNRPPREPQKNSSRRHADFPVETTLGRSTTNCCASACFLRRACSAASLRPLNLGCFRSLPLGKKTMGAGCRRLHRGARGSNPKKSLGVKTPLFVKVDRFPTKANGSMYTMEIGRIDRENGGFGKWRSPFQIWLFSVSMLNFWGVLSSMSEIQ